MIHRIAVGTATFGILAAATLGLASTASAAPTGGGNAADTINRLRAQGYDVQTTVENGPRSSQLSECTVNQVTGTDGTNAAGKPLTPAQAGTVYVDINCPEDES